MQKCESHFKNVALEWKLKEEDLFVSQTKQKKKRKKIIIKAKN